MIPMPLPSLAEDVLTLVSRPDLTPTERTLLKLAATLIVQARMEEDEFDQLNDPRIEMDREEYRTLPDRFELIAGKVRSKEWDSPERLAAAARNEQRIQAEMAKDLILMRIQRDTGNPIEAGQ
jgi:hypothetical protein